jgi:hypothetical protein
LPANIKLGWRGSSGPNTLAYYENSSIIVVKSVIAQAPGSDYSLMDKYCRACTIKQNGFVVYRRWLYRLYRLYRELMFFLFVSVTFTALDSMQHSKCITFL